MATAAQLDLLAAVHERSPEGVGVPADELRPLGGPSFDEDMAALEDEGLLVVVASGRGEPDTVAVTDEGRLALEPRSSL